MATKILVLGTSNEGKVREMRELLADVRLEIRGLGDFGGLPDVPETGNTFAENAALKASAYARLTGHWALADDSGLEVEALGGSPGVRSARFAGNSASDAENIEKLLQDLKNVESGKRGACFVCEMALSDPEGKIRHEAKGYCRGQISLKPIGFNGFGYDPIFIPDGFSETFGQIPGELKNEISHRTVAARKIKEFFENPGWERT